MTPAQCRGARGLLRWNQDELATAAQVSIVTVRNFELERSTPQRASLDVMRRAGQLGDASTLGVAKEQDSNNRALQQANDNLKNVTANYDRNAVALEANGRAQDQYRQLVDRGVPSVEAAAVAFGGLQTKIASATQAARFVQFDRPSRQGVGQDSSRVRRGKLCRSPRPRRG